MRFEEWEPHYLEILAYFGFDREMDEEAARVIAALAVRDDLSLLIQTLQGQEVTVCGNAPTLTRDLDTVRGIVLAADGAADVLDHHGIRPAVVFTDLDGATDRFLMMNEGGTIMVVHAHGDNIPLIRYWLPKFLGPFVATTQASPLPHVHNFGGFTDGDRAIFAADSLSARSIRLVGFDLDDPDVDPVKHGKLMWAGWLLSLTGHGPKRSHP